MPMRRRLKTEREQKGRAMPRSKKPAAGDNSNGLTNEEREALFLSHLDACRQQDATLEKAMESVRAVRKVRNKIRNSAKAEGFPLNKIDDILKKEGMSQKDLEAEAELFRWMDQMAGLPVGGQAELFASTPTEVKDGLDYEADGYRAGMRGLVGTPPDTVSPRFHQEWMKGWGAGQERNAWAMAEKGRIVDRRQDIKASAPELDPEPEDDFDPDAEARKLKGAGFLDTTTEPEAEAA